MWSHPLPQSTVSHSPTRHTPTPLPASFIGLLVPSQASRPVFISNRWLIHPKLSLSVCWLDPAKRAAGMCVEGKGLGSRASDKACLASVPLWREAQGWCAGDAGKVPCQSPPSPTHCFSLGPKLSIHKTRIKKKVFPCLSCFLGNYRCEIALGKVKGLS